MSEYTQVHICQSVRGPLMHWKDWEWRSATKWITKKDGSKFTGPELKSHFLQLLAEGNEVIPIGDCDNFDPKKGCLGHRRLDP